MERHEGIRKLLKRVVGVALLGWLAYGAYNFATAKARVRAICSQIRPGMNIAQLRHLVAARGMSPVPKESGTSYVVETKTFGRYGCKVITEAGVVKEATYNFAD